MLILVKIVVVERLRRQLMSRRKIATATATTAAAACVDVAVAGCCIFGRAMHQVGAFVVVTTTTHQPFTGMCASI